MQWHAGHLSCPNLLALSRSFNQKSRDELFHFLLPAFGTLHLPTIVFSYTDNSGKLLFTFWATIVIAGHSVILLSDGFGVISDIILHLRAKAAHLFLG